MEHRPKDGVWASWVDGSYALLVFRTNHELMGAEAALKAAKVRGRLTPKPRRAGADCSFALAVRSTVEAQALNVLRAGGWVPAAVGNVGKDGAWIPRK